MALAGGHQVSKVFVEVLDVPICFVADVGINLWSWCISNIAAVWKDSRVDSGDKLISMPDDIFL